MVQRKSTVRPKKRVWRITEAAPFGEFVDPDAPVAPAQEKEVPPHASWAMSSFELLHGTDVTDSADTVPDDLFDELFPSQKDPTDSFDRK